MEIYIETFLIQNILINFCLLRLVELTTKAQTSIYKMLLSSVVGSAFSVFIVGIISNKLLLNFIKLLCAVAMLIIAFKQTRKQFIFNFILLFVYTFAINGAITSFSSCTYYTNFGYVTATTVNLEVISLAIILITYVFQLIAKHLKFKLKTNNFIYKITLTKNNLELKLNAYLDSGNLIQLNNKPVVILDLDSYLKLAKINLIDFLTSESKTIQTKTVTGENMLKVFTIDKLSFTLNNKNICLKDQYIGVTTNNTFKNSNYKALLSPLMF